MEKKKCFAIPYRIETAQDIEEAQKQNFLHLGSDYDRMLKLSQRAKLRKPPALLKARPWAEKTFYMLREEKVKESNVTWLELKKLDIRFPYRRHFESLQQQGSYYVLCSKPDTNQEIISAGEQ